jgi:hypothetical protein
MDKQQKLTHSDVAAEPIGPEFKNQQTSVSALGALLPNTPNLEDDNLDDFAMTPVITTKDAYTMGYTWPRDDSEEEVPCSSSLDDHSEYLDKHDKALDKPLAIEEVHAVTR